MATAATMEDLTLNLTQEIQVHAPLETTFAALLEQMGPGNETHEGKPLAMKIEPWPGGRWYRDLGGNNGHFWALVQAIKRPTLLELCGPLFMSSPVMSNLQYRLSESGGVTLISFRHTALGVTGEEYRSGVKLGWAHMLARTRRQAEGK
jgi:uncharacterized protein YndB with AHSA1/START domain